MTIGDHGNQALGAVFRGLRANDIYDGKHSTEDLADGRCRHTVTWTQEANGAGNV